MGLRDPKSSEWHLLCKLVVLLTKADEGHDREGCLHFHYRISPLARVTLYIVPVTALTAGNTL